MGSVVVAAAAGALGAAGTVAAQRVLTARPPGGGTRWERTNYGGRTVTILGGAAAALGCAAGAAFAPAAGAGVLAAAGGGAFGALDDLTESQDGRAKGFRGHVGALLRGRLTTGGAKLLGITATSLVAAGLATRGGRGATAPARVVDVALSGALVAGTANLVNLLDLRPGRALKALVLLTGPLTLAGGAAGPLAAAVCGASVAALPADLRERTMLGDTGANALGAVAGTALAVAPSRALRTGVLAGVVALTAASERVSFSKVIERTPVLHRIDSWGRAPS